MCKPFSVICLLFLLLAVFIGCNATDKTEKAANSPLQTNAANAAPPPEKQELQYMAVCITTEEHEGNEYILTRWVETKYEAQIYGREHARKKKGHNVIYRERAKP